MEAIYPVLAWLITPAVILGVVGYFARFFGKIIVDQNPFADERDWAVELSGFMFTLNLSVGIVGSVIALNAPHFGFGVMHWLNLFILLMLGGIFAVANARMFADHYRLDATALRKRTKADPETVHLVETIGRKIPHFPIPLVLGYIGTVEFLSGDLVWIVISWTIIILILLSLAANFSLRKFKERVGTEIHFVDPSRETLHDVLVLKVNDDNIRIRVQDRIMIINKDEVFKIEFEIPREKLPQTEG